MPFSALRNRLQSATSGRLEQGKYIRSLSPQTETAQRSRRTYADRSLLAPGKTGLIKGQCDDTKGDGVVGAGNA